MKNIFITNTKDMNYEGKLYGKVEKIYFPLIETTKDYDDMKQQIKELKEVIENALRIKNLWLLGDSVPEEHIDEARALSEMESSFKQALKVKQSA